MQITDIFKRLRNGETISPDDPQAYRMHEASYNGGRRNSGENYQTPCVREAQIDCFTESGIKN
ncbi:hypothetical protein [Proteiniphilum sp.]|uniref:hypothetical protein n=1 Tax=Proteiniphilum sp. TaxID=1926877 RepID=UPI002B216EE7|nr:hypothetical protein [Proteiniphilum sp.]MEA4916624.1 hypothetical protein [Proteiniphilum sp.]